MLPSEISQLSFCLPYVNHVLETYILQGAFYITTMLERADHFNTLFINTDAGSLTLHTSTVVQAPKSLFEKQ